MKKWADKGQKIAGIFDAITSDNNAENSGLAANIASGKKKLDATENSFNAIMGVIGDTDDDTPTEETCLRFAALIMSNLQEQYTANGKFN